MAIMLQNSLVRFFLVSFLFLFGFSSAIDPRKLFLVQEQPLVLKYHNGPLLKGNYSINVLYYGRFTPAQRSIIVDFIKSLTKQVPSSRTPTVSSWWRTTEKYRGGGASAISLGYQLVDAKYSLGKILKSTDILKLARGAGRHRNAITLVLTSSDVVVGGFCMNTCGSHKSATTAPGRKAKFTYIWVGNSASQCPGQCAWPFHQPLIGPQSPPLVSPNNDVGIDGMIINIATLLAGTVTNPFGNGFFQGPATAPLEAVTACPGVFGSGSFPGYPGKTLKDSVTGASYNAVGIAGRKYLLPAMWDPKTSQCATLV